MARHSLDFWLTSEDLPSRDNRVTLDREGRIELRYTPNNEEGHKRLIAKLEHLLPAGKRRRRARPRLPQRTLRAKPLRRAAHPARRRRAPERHDPLRPRPGDVGARRHCKAHDLDNLYVVDGSFFPRAAR
jgi:hypothetical protein